MFSKGSLAAFASVAAIILTVLASLPGLVTSVAAQSGAVILDLKATVPVSNLVLYPPSPCNQAIRLSGNFIIGAHIVYPTDPIHQPTLITLHLDATSITGIGQADGAPYFGSQGTSEGYQVTSASPNVLFQAAFDLVPSQPSQYPTDPICPANVSFRTGLFQADNGVITLSASLVGPD